MSVSRSVKVRDELQDLIRRDLLGPWGEPTEVLDATPRNRYLLGMLAPVVVDPRTPVARDSDTPGKEEQPDLATEEEHHVAVAGDPVRVEAGQADEQEHQDDEVAGALVHPSSMGLRCQVPRSTRNLRVVARWGRYSSRRQEDGDGHPVTRWVREPVEKSVMVDLGKRRHRYDLDGDDVSIDVEAIDEPDRIVVEVALINRRRSEGTAPPQDWLFQSEVEVLGAEDEAVFLATNDPMQDDRLDADAELRHLALLYRNRLEYAIGRTCAVTVTDVPGQRRARSVKTTWLPRHELPQTRAVGAEGVLVDMEALEAASPDLLREGITPLIEGYATWLTLQEQTADGLSPHLREIAGYALETARWTHSRLVNGLKLLTDPSQAGHAQTLQAFRFMNRTMRAQRVHTQIAAARSARSDLGFAEAQAEVLAKGAKAWSWRPFQLAFILMQLPALTDPTEPSRSGDAPYAELLFFPTGGGKTEAYLGLAAFTFAIRRLQGRPESADGGLDGGGGVAVLMRYTLRLLTAQQFLRATTLVCAAELVRREDPGTWGAEPFRIGLWVGSRVSPKRFSEAKRQIEDARSQDGRARAHGLTVLQVKRCPWCGSEIDPKRDLAADPVAQRVFVRCGRSVHGDVCEFSANGIVDDGIPVLTVDEEIYRHPPTFLLATVDKFARLAREGEAASLFGYVRERCERHGYRHEDSKSCTSAKGHTRKGAHDAAAVVGCGRLRPPDLIIQDELHLISGALGTAVGLFESAVDVLCSWETGDGKTVRPLVVASTATMRNAAHQVRRLYGRDVAVFPPPVLDVADTYFSKEVEISDENPGRRYLGVCAHGARLTLAEIRVSEILLLAGQKLLDEHGEAADPYTTLVGYFNATRELAGMRRFMDDDVTTRVSDLKRDPRGLPRRTSTDLNIGELTSRISSGDIAFTLDRMSVPFDPEQHSTAARQRWAAQQAKARTEAKGRQADKANDSTFKGGRPFDVVLATSMLQVGVDVPRLGLMVVVGQPKNTAEYIQASSRVGREADKPGFVVTLANWARPRDMAHFEQFEYYHQTFYSHVEALSVTPYSDSSLDRGLSGVLVSAARVMDAVVGPSSLSPNEGAGHASGRRKALDVLVGRIAQRAADSMRADDLGKHVRQKLTKRVDVWADKAGKYALAYQPAKSETQNLQPLLVSPEVTHEAGEWSIFRVANSMREVQPEINLLVQPSRLAAESASEEPAWQFTPTEDRS